MKRRSIAQGALLGLLLLLLPAGVSAHGGMEHNTDDAVVTLYQTPMSPLPREAVETDFIFADKSGNRLTNMPVKLTVTDTYFGNESKDKVIVTRQFTTDTNGILRFKHHYSAPDFYDIDLDFAVGDKPQEAGFLLSVRNPYKNWYSLTYVPVLLLGAGAGWLAAKWFGHSKRAKE